MLREVEISSPPLSKPHLPQNFEVKPFPLPVLPLPDIPVGGRLAHSVEQWEELTDNRWVLSIVRNGFQVPIQVSSIVPINLPVLARKNRRTSQETGSGKDSKSGNSRFLFPAIPSAQKERKVTPGNRSFLTKSVYKQTAFQDGDSQKKVREKSRECHNHKPQPFPDPKRKRKPTNPNKHKSNKRTKSTKISSLFPKRGNRNTKRTKKHNNKMTHGKTYNKSPRRINHKATKSKTNTGTTALERSVE